MSGNTIGKLFTVTSFGESHGPAIGCIVDGCPPGLALTEADCPPMNSFNRWMRLCALLGLGAVAIPAPASPDSMKLTLTAPITTGDEALPLGNGLLAILVTGIQFWYLWFYDVRTITDTLDCSWRRTWISGNDHGRLVRFNGCYRYNGDHFIWLAM